MYSPRSVSTGVTPACSSASLRSISSVAIDFDFTAIRTPLVPAESQHDRARLLGGGRPVDVAAQPLDVVGQPLQVLVEVLQRASLIARARSRSASPSGKPRERLLAEVDELGGGDRERFLQERVLEGRAGALAETACAAAGVAHATSPSPAEHLGQVHRPHARAAPRQPAAHLHEAARVARHQAVAPGGLRRWRASCRGSAVDTSGSRTENEPPKPQHSSAPGSSTSSRAGARRAAGRAAWPTRPARAAGGRSRGRSPCPLNGDSIVRRPRGPRRGTATARRVRRASASAAAGAAPDRARAARGTRASTIHAQEPDGTTTCSAPSKSSTVRAATRAASWW